MSTAYQKPVAKATAEKVLKKVIEHHKAYLEAVDYPLPRLYPPGHEGDMWVIWWEEGPIDWAITSCYPLQGTVPGTFLEPVYSGCLGIYRS